MPPCHGGDRRFESGRARQTASQTKPKSARQHIDLIPLLWYYSYVKPKTKMTQENLPHHQPTLEEQYELLGYYQQDLADILVRGVNAGSWEDAYDHFKRTRVYTSDTSRSTFLDHDDVTPVVDYVANTIDGEARKDFSGGVDAKEALDLNTKYYQKYELLARFKGYDLSDDQLARVYFPMRHLYREASRAAVIIGDTKALASLQEDWSQYSRGVEEEMRDYDDEYQERSDVYQRFLLNKDDDQVWHEVIHRAQHEDERGEVPRHELQGIGTEELSDLAGLLRGQTKDEQYVTLTRNASNGKSWNEVLTGLGDTPLARTLKRFLEAVVTTEELEAKKKDRLHHAVILGGRDIKAIDQMVFSKDRHAKGGVFTANPIADNVTVVEPSERLRATDEKILADETQVKFVDGSPADMPLEKGSQKLIVGTRNTEGMDKHTLSDFYLELARVLRNGGVYVESNRTRSINGISLSLWKSLLAQMIVDTVEDRGAIPDRMDPDREDNMLKGLGLTKQTFKYDGREILTLVKRGAVKELGWYAMQGRGSERLFGIEIGGEPDKPKWTQKRETTPNTVVW